MEINEMSKRAHENSTSKGFYDLPNEILHRMGKLDFDEEQIKAVRDAFICQRLMLITSELSEALESNRKDKNANVTAMYNNLYNLPFPEAFEGHVKDTFEDELADATIRIGDLAEWLEIDLDKHVDLKQKYNSSRTKMHGGKAY